MLGGWNSIGLTNSITVVGESRSGRADLWIFFSIIVLERVSIVGNRHCRIKRKNVGGGASKRSWFHRSSGCSGLIYLHYLAEPLTPYVKVGLITLYGMVLRIK